MNDQKIIEMSGCNCGAVEAAIIACSISHALLVHPSDSSIIRAEWALAYEIWKSLKSIPSDGGPELNRAVARFSALAHNMTRRYTQ